MADETFDVVVVGGGSKALVTATYLQTYGGMKVGIFERMHELGGSWCTLERLAPGFLGDTHASIMADWYFLPLLYDFPEFEEYGGRFWHYPAGTGIIMKDAPEDSLLVYNHYYDPTGELTAKEIARYSEADAEVFLKFDRAHFEGGRKEAFLEAIFSLPPPPDQLDPYERWFKEWLKQPDCPMDEHMMVMSMLQSGRVLFDSVEFRTLFTTTVARVDVSPNKPMGGAAWFAAQYRREVCRVIGGTHHIAHALIRIFVENGGKFYSKSEVDKIIVEDEAAKGIRLVDGTEVRAKVVVSGQDPWQLCFRFTGKEHLDRKVVRKVAAIERDESMINWYTFAVRELPNYIAAARNPMVNNTTSIHIAERDDTQMAKEWCLRYCGIEPQAPQVRVFPDGEDPTRHPEGKGTILAETLTLPLQARSEREWLKYKIDIARYMIDEIHAVAPNITWDSVIGVDSCGPYDIAGRHLNMPTGNQLVVDQEPASKGKYGPIPEWADHRIRPLKNLYGTGNAWGSGSQGGGHCGQGYRCYKAIAEDFGLRKPWEEKNRPW